MSAETRSAAATTAWHRGTIALTLIEDAHPGSGAGGGGLDGLVARDRHDRPVIWASHLEGLLRDAARRLYPDHLVNVLFGRAGGQRQRAVFSSLYATERPTARVWRATARASFDNRAPRADTLRAHEHVPRGTVFTGEIEFPADLVDTLDRLLKELDAVGHGRAVGVGRVRIEFSATPCAPATAPDVPTAATRMLLRLRAVDPLCIAATATPGNLIPTLAYLPGRTVAGALAAWLVTNGHQAEAEAIMGPDVSIGDGLPLPESASGVSPDRVEVLPAPLTLMSAKPPGQAESVPWWSTDSSVPERCDGAARPKATAGPKLKRPEPDLHVARVDGGKWSAYRPETRIRLRNGRPIAGQPDPSLFAVEHICEETHFLVEVRAACETLRSLSAALSPILARSRWIRVGRSGAPVEVAAVAFAGDQSPPPAPADGDVLLILTSDLLVRDDRLCWRTAMGTDDWAALSGWPGSLTVSSLSQEEARIHGFNATSGMWRLPIAGIRRGSVYRVEGAGIAELARRATAGEWLGERTHEGFGRFRIDTSLPGVVKGATPSEPGIVADDPDDAVARTTCSWFDTARELAGRSSAEHRRPSLSQWHDFIADLEARGEQAIAERREPTTAGAAGWRHRKAHEVLTRLVATDPDERVAFARMFVRWLRAEIQGVRS
ncbi:MAG: hypothetical protein KF817_03015 [Phycisphaeraceae bacterium]|nr:hypothetical protein [Phycisphaeraceae bacterium]